jgi:5-formyltetrahydrofolate cyclo-ligase
MEAKSSLRRAIKERLARMSEAERRVESQVIVRTLDPLLVGKKTIAVYMPYIDEPNIRPIILQLLKQKNVVCMPKVEGLRMKMHRIHSLDDVDRNPVTNIIEPTENTPIDESSIDVVIVPGRAFTKEGVRMGRGNGGYDRWITEQRKRNSATKYIGVCFECQMLTEIPTEGHDERLHTVITASGKFESAESGK